MGNNYGLFINCLFAAVSIFGLLAKLLHRRKSFKGFYVLLGINAAWGYISVALAWWPNLVATAYFTAINCAGARFWRTHKFLTTTPNHVVLQIGACMLAATTVVANVLYCTGYVSNVMALQTCTCAFVMYGYLLSVWQHRLTYICFSIGGLAWLPIAIQLAIWPMVIKTISYAIIDIATIKTWWR